jgi:hypothetical protein
MNSATLRSGALAAVLVSTLVLMSCSTPDAPAAPLAPPAPPPPPALRLSSQIVETAAVYQSYLRQASAISPTFTQGDQIQASLKQGEAYEPKQLSRGVVAYAAILALQEPSFVTGVRAYAADPAQRADMINKIYADPAYAAQLPGAQAAAGLIVSQLDAEGSAIHRAGAAIKQSAYDIQRESWSKEFVKDREGRLAVAKQLSSVPAAPSSDEAARLHQAALTGTGLGVSARVAQPPYTQAVIRGLAVAALAALGAAGDENAAQITTLLDDGSSPYCLSMSKLNLYQCLAVSKPHFEDVFCLGQHALMDTGRCVQKVAGTAPVEQTTLQRMTAAREAAANGRPVAAIGTAYNDLNKPKTKAKKPAPKKK